MWMPSSLSVFLSAIILTMPSVSALARARELARKGNLPTLYSMPASLHIDPWKEEPDTRSGDKPTALKGTLKVSGLTAGATYDIYRWDSVGEAFSYRDAYKKASFTATSDSYVYTDDTSFPSNGATYYRVVRAA